MQGKLKKIRAAIREVVPGSTETVSYFHIPISYEGYFSFKKPDVRLHLRPPVMDDHKRELAGYATKKAIVSFPVDKEVPIALVKELVNMKDKSG